MTLGQLLGAIILGVMILHSGMAIVIGNYIWGRRNMKGFHGLMATITVALFWEWFFITVVLNKYREKRKRGEHGTV